MDNIIDLTTQGGDNEINVGRKPIISTAWFTIPSYTTHPYLMHYEAF